MIFYYIVESAKSLVSQWFQYNFKPVLNCFKDFGLVCSSTQLINVFNGKPIVLPFDFFFRIEQDPVHIIV